MVTLLPALDVRDSITKTWPLVNHKEISDCRGNRWCWPEPFTLSLRATLAPPCRTALERQKRMLSKPYHTELGLEEENGQAYGVEKYLSAQTNFRSQRRAVRPCRHGGKMRYPCSSCRSLALDHMGNGHDGHGTTLTTSWLPNRSSSRKIPQEGKTLGVTSTDTLETGRQRTACQQAFNPETHPTPKRGPSLCKLDFSSCLLLKDSWNILFFCSQLPGLFLLHTFSAGAEILSQRY